MQPIRESPEDSFWLGASDKNEAREFRWANSTEPLKFAKWFSGEPRKSEDEAMPSCVRMCPHGDWFATPCLAPVKYTLCEKLIGDQPAVLRRYHSP